MRYYISLTITHRGNSAPCHLSVPASDMAAALTSVELFSRGLELGTAISSLPSATLNIESITVKKPRGIDFVEIS